VPRGHDPFTGASSGRRAPWSRHGADLCACSTAPFREGRTATSSTDHDPLFEGTLDGESLGFWNRRNQDRAQVPCHTLREPLIGDGGARLSRPCAVLAMPEILTELAYFQVYYNATQPPVVEGPHNR